MAEFDANRLPRHVAIIMDGNGRWAKKRLWERVRGHEQGANTVNTTVREARRLGIKALSLYAFSEENWARPKLEVEALMRLLERYLIDQRSEILDNDIRLTVSGRIDELPSFVRQKLDPLLAESHRNTGMILNLCLAYSGHTELADAAQALAREVAAGTLKPEDITPARFAAHLYVPELPPVDLLIRTSGEQRVSGFLPWQLAYAEFYFPEVLWPDFTTEHFHEALRAFSARDRRFGLVR